MATLPLRGGAYVQQKKENIRKKRLLHSETTRNTQMMITLIILRIQTKIGSKTNSMI